MLAGFTLASAQSGQPVVDKLKQYITSAKSLACELKLSSPGVPTQGHVKMSYVRDRSLFYSIDWTIGNGRLDYKFVLNPTLVWDADMDAKVYDETPNYNQSFGLPLSRISNAPALFSPSFLYYGTPLQTNVPVQVVGSETVDGVSTTHISGKAATTQLDLYIASDGKPVRYVTKPDQGRPIIADIVSLVRDKSLPEQTFPGNPPLGFNEYTTPLPLPPAQVGKPFPAAGWKSAKGDSTGLDGAISKREAMVMVTTEDCDPSSAAADALGKMENVNVVVATLSPTGAAPRSLSSFPLYYDPTGKVASQVEGPGTPLFYLIGKDGKIVKVWFGYDPDHEAEFLNDVQYTIKNGNQDTGDE